MYILFYFIAIIYLFTALISIIAIIINYFAFRNRGKNIFESAYILAITAAIAAMISFIVGAMIKRGF